MLRKEAVSPQLLKLLQRLMSLPELHQHQLVGGTALALQIGHRRGNIGKQIMFWIVR